MAIAVLGKQLRFPDPSQAHPSGVLAVGGDLSPDRLLLAYSRGIFPWPAEGYPLLWHCPAERFVVRPAQVRINRTLGKVLRRHPYRVTIDEQFADVIAHCARVPRAGQDGTWITAEMVEAYCALHRMGFAHSVEAWQDGAGGATLVGGLYGVSLGKAFSGESMFSLASNASKVAFVSLAVQLQRRDFALIDAQVHTPLLQALGGQTLQRAEFLAELARAVAQPVAPGRWQLDADLADGTAGLGSKNATNQQLG